MKYIVIIIYLIWASLLTPLAAKPDSVADSFGITPVDMRHGLSESRVRALLMLDDGRLAIATAAWLDIFDRTSFVNIPINRNDGFKIGSVAKKRTIYHDADGNLWLKTPASRHNDTGTIHVFNPENGADITMDVLRSLDKDHVKDIFIDEQGRQWILDNNNMLRIKHDGSYKNVFSLSSIDASTPVAISSKGRRLYLCYDDARISVVDPVTGAISYTGLPNLPFKGQKHLIGEPKLRDGKIWILIHRHNHDDKSWVASLDTLNWQWSVFETDTWAHDFDIDTSGTPITALPGIDKKIYGIVRTKGGDLWVGTKEHGLYYVNSHPKAVENHPKEKYPYSRTNQKWPPRAEALLRRHFPEGVNSCVEDSVSGWIYAGTRNGLAIFDNHDSFVTTLGENIGLPQSNVQGVAVGSDGAVWLSTVTGISRVCRGDGNFEAINLGRLEGIDLDGTEFYANGLCIDSTGTVTAGYPGGYYTVRPGELVLDELVVHRMRPYVETEEDPSSTSSIWIFLVAGILAATVIILILQRRHLRYNQPGANESETITPISHNTISAEKEVEAAQLPQLSAQEVIAFDSSAVDIRAVGPKPREINPFIERLNVIIAENLSDEDLNVETLSRLMAMDRTNLYRKMQSALGMPPSTYIRVARLKTAARMLSETEIPVADIAVATGFSSSKYFTACFKAEYNMLPKDFRKARKSADFSHT